MGYENIPNVPQLSGIKRRHFTICDEDGTESTCHTKRRHVRKRLLRSAGGEFAGQIDARTAMKRVRDLCSDDCTSPIRKRMRFCLENFEGVGSNRVSEPVFLPRILGQEDIVEEIDASSLMGVGRESSSDGDAPDSDKRGETVPSVDAVLLADGRCAVRIVRPSGVVQAVVINPPEF